MADRNYAQLEQRSVGVRSLCCSLPSLSHSAESDVGLTFNISIQFPYRLYRSLLLSSLRGVELIKKFPAVMEPEDFSNVI
jgi:hypothetical protein